MMKELNEASIRTKIRRLYDIINVFRSVGLVKKASLPSKKSGYQWAGTEYLE
jgi:transcription factor E2F7/8